MPPLPAVTSLHASSSSQAPWAPALTFLSTQATERPANRLATPRATLTSSLRMSSHRLLRNLNSLSVYVATPGERRKGGSGWMDGPGYRFWPLGVSPGTCRKVAGTLVVLSCKQDLKQMRLCCSGSLVHL